MRLVNDTYDPAADTVTRAVRFRRTYCEADARRGTGTGVCGRPLDDHGQCDRAADHA